MTITFNEGVPGAGKSYDAIKTHVVPALRKGRTVYIRMNGAEEPEKRAALASHLGISIEELDVRYIHVPTSEVAEFFIAIDDGEQWLPHEKFQNALVVIDEAHQFYLGGTRDALPRHQEEFFAMHRHRGIDIVLMTQAYKRLHTAIRYRIEVKNTFQKLSALGKVGESKYSQTHWVTVAPDKYEKTNSTTHTYDKAMFPLYRGVASSDVSTEVYAAGRSSVWSGMLLRAAIVVPLAIFGIWYLVSFFAGGGTKLVKPKETTQTFAAATPAQGAEPRFVDGAPGVAPRVDAAAPQGALHGKVGAVVAPDPLDGMQPGQRYVWGLAEKARARLAAVIGEGADARGLVEWVTPAGEAIDRLTFVQLRALGVDVVLESFGVQLSANDQVQIVTAWPLNVPLRDEQPRLYDTSQGQGASGGASEASPAGSAPAIGINTEPSSVADYGQFRLEKRG